MAKYLLTSEEDGAVSAAFVLGGETGSLDRPRLKPGEIRSLIAGGRERILVGAGEDLREAAAVLGRHLTVRESIAEITVDPGSPEAVTEVVEGLEFGLYRFQAGGESPAEPLIRLLAGPSAAQALQRAEAVTAGVRLARDLVNLPGNLKRPGSWRGLLRERLPDSVRVSEIKGEELRRLGAGGLLAVGAGSEESPRFLLLELGDGRPATALIGKGITFDSGGLSLKPADDLPAMKADVGGAAAVAGAFFALALLGWRRPLLGILAVAENLPDGRSYRPGDVVRTMAGKTVEIVSTDAEGRLALADGLELARRLGAGRLLDIATLTGACTVALGTSYAALFGNDEEWVGRVVRAAARTGERVWRLPLEPAYRRAIESSVADLKNSGGRPAGAITAALFLAEFVGSLPWVHLDIAGKAFRDRESSHRTAGATGYGVRTLVEILAGEGE